MQHLSWLRSRSVESCGRGQPVVAVMAAFAVAPLTDSVNEVVFGDMLSESGADVDCRAGTLRSCGRGRLSILGGRPRSLAALGPGPMQVLRPHRLLARC